MAKENPTLQRKLDALLSHAFGKDPKQDEKVLTAAISDSHSRLVAKASDLAAERLVYAAITALKNSFAKFLEDPIKKDPQCAAKQAIARALVALDCSDAQFWIAGLRCRQMEPGWGLPTDTAMDVRASCAMGLVNSGSPRALFEVAALLNDSEARARSGAARAIACGKPSEAELLLRFKVAIGDADGEVLGECMSALLQVAGGEGVPAVAQHLHGDDEVTREYAALALGESQLPEALAALKESWKDVFITPEKKRLLTRAAALHRSDGAYDWLLSIIAEGSVPSAEAAIEALSIYKKNDRLTERVRSTLRVRGAPRLDAHFQKCWS